MIHNYFQKHDKNDKNPLKIKILLLYILFYYTFFVLLLFICKAFSFFLISKEM